MFMLALLGTSRAYMCWYIVR